MIFIEQNQSVVVDFFFRIYLNLSEKMRASESPKYEYDLGLMIDTELSLDLAESILRTCKIYRTICHFW